jgi:hypothetical protein
MKGTSRCSDYGHPDLVTSAGKPYWQPALRATLSWNSHERVVERRIIKAFVRSGGERVVHVPVPAGIEINEEFISRVKRLVSDSMYRVDIRVSGLELVVTAV